MKRIWAIAALALVTMACADTGRPLAVHEGGRSVRDADGALRSGWPGVYYEARFSGTSVNVGVETRRETVRVLIDGVERSRIARPFSGQLIIDELTPGEHLVRLERLTESQPGEIRFLGFFTAEGQALSPPPARAKRIEFIGDSHSVGYGNTSPTRDCDGARVHVTTDTQQAYGPLLAKRLDADYRVIAWSGFGVVRNYAGNMPGESLPSIYWRAVPGEAVPLANDGWKPQLIVIYLGTNDFSTPVKAGEAWADEAALRTAWRTRYAGFVRELAAKQPQARFVLIGGPSFDADTRAVAAALNGSMARPVVTVTTPAMELTGCNWHPSLKDQRSLADLLEGAIGRMPGLWD
ncbi:SGNH/GDSL hydrolase family protein [Sphingomonas sp. G-3-2-10]|uniref:SGNH/GDSL hydrolase family protein n=1 Tax=Sphingomonas sp. G-3-2-10 TaxID=2728838 RepID=UPI00146C4ACF|nr:SGNH/GDSL hydrolase family protein [Sphingomonas sp. G-3-2-10]NML07066.1 SGNH/GDSL hydrolase family protein [Sphingomonas sp. G-3-2-10]